MKVVFLESIRFSVQMMTNPNVSKHHKLYLTI